MKETFISINIKSVFKFIGPDYNYITEDILPFGLCLIEVTLLLNIL